MVACPGKERLVKVGTRGRDAKDAGNFDAYKLQCRQLVDGSEGKRGRGLLEQIAAALQRVATGARVAERRGFGGSRAYGLVAAALMKVVADLARHAAKSGHDGECVGVGRVDGNVPGFVGRVRDGDALVVIGSIGNAEGRDRGLFVTLPAFALASTRYICGAEGSDRSTPGSHSAKGSGLTPLGTYQIFLVRSHLAPSALASSLCEKGTSSSVRMAAPWCCRCKWLKDTAGRRHRGVLSRSCGSDGFETCWSRPR